MSFNGAGQFHPRELLERLRKQRVAALYHILGLHLIRDPEQFEKKLLLEKLKHPELDEEIIRSRFEEDQSFREKMKANKTPYRKLRESLRTPINR